MLLPLSLHYLYIRFSSSNMCFSPYYFSIADSNVGYVHSLSPIKKARSGKLYYNFDLQTSPTNSQEWLDLTRIRTLKHCISRLQKVQLKLSILLKKKIQSLSTKQAQLSKLAAVTSTFCAQLHQQSKGKRRKQSPVRQI